ncbi:recombinase family protein [Baia soyae]|uniref:recombinase family protein n=1 Tax=Baia soyae TaxID=1544746 RepID=UPI0010504365
MRVYNIAKHLNKSGIQFQNGSMWKQFTISSIIQNVTYIGKIQFKKRSTQNQKIQDITKALQEGLNLNGSM